MRSDWPFDQSRKTAAITLRSIVFEGKPILFVSHDADDHGWQFMDGERVATKNAAVVTMEEIVGLDSSILEIADLPSGSCAWREDASSPWQRSTIKS
jgi:hypothetical protein